MKRASAVMLCFLTLAVAATQAADTKPMKSRDGSCQVSVPADWVVESMGLGGHSPDNKTTAVVSSPKMVDSFSQLKQTAKSVYSESKATKDSASEFVMEGQSITHIPDVYRAIPIAAGKYCIVEVIYKTGDPAVARTIAASLSAGK